MNANKWPLENMEQAVYEVNYSPAESRQRLEALHEPRVRQFFHSSFDRYRTRTNVELKESSPTQLLYCVQRVHRRTSNRIWNVFAEGNVLLEPSGPRTRVTVYTSSSITKAQLSWIAAYLISLLSGLLVVVISLNADTGIPWLIVAIVAVSSFVYFVLDVRHFRRQRQILQDQIAQALNFPADPYFSA